MTTKPETPAVETTAVDHAANLDAAVKAERVRILNDQKQINALCRVAGRPEMAAAFNESGKTLPEVVAELDKLGKTADEPHLSARHGVDTGDRPPVIDVDAIWNKWNSIKATA